MDDNSTGNDILKDTQGQIDTLNASYNTYKQLLADVVAQQELLRQSGQRNTDQYAQLTQQFTNLMQSTRAASGELQQLNNVLTQQQSAITAANERTDGFSKTFESVAGSFKNFGKVVKSLSPIIGTEAAKGFDPITKSLKEAVETFEPFKKGLDTVRSTYANFKNNIASGQGVFESFINSNEGVKKLFGAFADGAGTLKVFKTALADTGMGLLIIAVSALIEAFQKWKPAMDIINGAIAAMGAMFNVLKDSILGLFTHPIDTIKNFGSSMGNAAKDAYNLVAAQEALAEATNKQEIANQKIKNQIELLKETSKNTRLNIDQRRKALNDAYAAEQKNYNDNAKLHQKALDNAIMAAKTKKNLDEEEITNLKKFGAEYAATLLGKGAIEKEQFEDIKKAESDLMDVQQQSLKSARAFREDQLSLDDEVTAKNNERKEKEKERQKEQQQKQIEAQEKHLEHLKTLKQAAEAFDAEALHTKAESVARMAMLQLKGYEKEVTETQQHYDSMLEKYTAYIKDYNEKAKNDPEYRKANRKAFTDAVAAELQIKKEKTDALIRITDTFQQQDLAKLQTYENQLLKIKEEAGLSAQQLAIAQLQKEEKDKEDIIIAAKAESEKRLKNLQEQIKSKYNSNDEKAALQKQIDAEIVLQTKGDAIKIELTKKLEKDTSDIKEQGRIKEKQEKENELNEAIKDSQQKGDNVKAIQFQQQLFKMKHDAAVENAKKTNADVAAIDDQYNKQKLQSDLELAQARMHVGDQLIDSILKNTKKDSAAYKAAFLAKKATSIGDIIVSTEKAVISSLSAYSSIPFIGQALGIAQAAFMAGQGAASIAKIVKQKPGFAKGGQFISDGRGAVLSGYSRTDDTNAYLRSGEAVVVSEAMRNPWARNLVSAINVMHGGRDFSVTNPGRGYAIGGIFTDGGNANRYYSQPVQDQKNLANTIAYQMINNFPPVYVDVKDINNQQNILAQTINRVNL